MAAGDAALGDGRVVVMPQSGYACRPGFLPPSGIVTAFSSFPGRRGSSIPGQLRWQAMLCET